MASKAESGKRHTPGPWEVVPCSNGGMLLVRGQYGQHQQSHLQILPEADARLIASAPEMLGALEEVCGYLSDISSGDAPEGYEIYSRCMSAIRKARGESEGSER